MQTSEWTACIPVRDEERTLARTVTSIKNQTASQSLVSILIGANGCRDNTVRIARDLSRQDPRIQVIESPIPGKARMWNTLFNQAPTNNIVFTDGDVVLHENAAENLVKAINTSKDAMIGGSTVSYVNDLPLFQRFLGSAYANHNGSHNLWLTGQLYILDNLRVRAKLLDKGIPEMPEKVLHEDNWLTHALHPDWSVIPEARAFSRPYGLHELNKLRRRYIIADTQVESDLYPRIMKRWNPIPKEKDYLSVRFKRALRTRTHSYEQFLAYCIAFSITNLSKGFNESSARRKFACTPNYWESSQYSKIPLPEGLEFTKLN